MIVLTQLSRETDDHRELCATYANHAISYTCLLHDCIHTTGPPAWRDAQLGVLVLPGSPLDITTSHAVQRTCSHMLQLAHVHNLEDGTQQLIFLPRCV